MATPSNLDYGGAQNITATASNFTVEDCRSLWTRTDCHGSPVEETESVVVVSGQAPSISPTSPFRFLDLPRELRDRIYAYALVYGEISIETAACELPGPRSFRQSSNYRAPRTAVAFQSTFIVPSSGKKLKRHDWKYGVDGLQHATYKLDRPLRCEKYHYRHEEWCEQCAALDSEIHLGLLSASRQLHFEASDIFYKRNKFCFSDEITGWPSTVCLTFLHDRPIRALGMIRGLNLNFAGERCNCCTTATEDWDQLLLVLQTRLQLSHLGLKVDDDAYFDHLGEIEKHLVYPWLLETRHVGCCYGSPWRPPSRWITDLLHAGIEVKSLSLIFDVGRPSWMWEGDELDEEYEDALLLNVKSTAMALRERLLKNGKLLGQRGIHFTKSFRGKEKFWVHTVGCYDNEKGLSLYKIKGIGLSDAWPKPATEEYCVGWRRSEDFGDTETTTVSDDDEIPNLLPRSMQDHLCKLRGTNTRQRILRLKRATGRAGIRASVAP